MLIGDEYRIQLIQSVKRVDFDSSKFEIQKVSRKTGKRNSEDLFELVG